MQWPRVRLRIPQTPVPITSTASRNCRISSVYEGFSSCIVQRRQNYRLDVCHNEYSQEYHGNKGPVQDNFTTVEFVYGARY